MKIKDWFKKTEKNKSENTVAPQGVVRPIHNKAYNEMKKCREDTLSFGSREDVAMVELLRRLCRAGGITALDREQDSEVPMKVVYTFKSPLFYGTFCIKNEYSIFNHVEWRAININDTKWISFPVESIEAHRLEKILNIGRLELDKKDPEAAIKFEKQLDVPELLSCVRARQQGR